MKEVDADMLISLATQALERTAFVLANPVGAETAGEYPPLTRFARICYDGPAAGEVLLGATDGFVVELASSLLGVEQEEVRPEGEGADALKELANIIGGSLIRELGGETCEYSIGLPDLGSASDGPKAGEESIVCCLDSETELLRITWVSRAQRGAAAA